MRVFILSCLLCTACAAPIMVGTAGATGGSLAIRRKGLGGTMSDTNLSLKVRNKIVAKDQEWKTHLASRVGVAVQNGEVLLTGCVDDPEHRMWAEQAVWEVDGVKQVVNRLSAGKKTSFKQSLKDSQLTLSAKATVLGLKDVRSLNYSIKTHNGVVYVMGIARNSEERQNVVDAVARIKGVQKVVSLVRLKHELGV